jgi:sialate O-acetylesterase
MRCIDKKCKERTKKLSLSLLLVFFLSIIFLVPGFADVRLPSVIGNDMVLQREKPIQVWGWADPGEKVTFNGSWGIGQDCYATADANGEWKVQLPAAKAGGPFKLTITGKNTIELTNILIGEVWVCSGQSNMHFALNDAFEGKEAAQKAYHSKIRLFTVPVHYSLEPQSDTRSNWQACSPETAGEFSAIGFFFGLKLHKELDVPIGLIDSSVGGTAAELWTPEESLNNQPVLSPILERWDKVDKKTKKFYSEGMNFDFQFDNFKFIPKSSKSEALLLDDFEDTNLLNQMGGRWLTKSFDTVDNTAIDLVSPGSNGSGKALRFRGLMNVGEFFHLVANFGPDGEAVDLGDYKAISFDVQGKGFYRFFFHQPTIDDWDDYSLKKEVSSDWENVEIKFTDLKQAGWGVQMPFTPDRLSEAVFEPAMSKNKWGLPRPPGALYNGMISPIVPFSIRGAIWHQGSANASRAYQYRTLLPTMISGWRNAWGQGDFPFLVVQLQRFKKRKKLPTEDEWAELREAQLMTLDLPNTGMTVNIDIGNEFNIHQKNKKDVAHRLALWALGTTYCKDIIYSGPLYESMEIINGRIKLKFKHTGSTLVVKGGTDLRGFAIAGADQKFYWAEAEIESNYTVVVSNKEVLEPAAVRYGWQANPDCNLYNSANLPASPFRTDDWPGITIDRK